MLPVFIFALLILLLLYTMLRPVEAWWRCFPLFSQFDILTREGSGEYSSFYYLAAHLILFSYLCLVPLICTVLPMSKLWEQALFNNVMSPLKEMYGFKWHSGKLSIIRDDHVNEEEVRQRVKELTSGCRCRKSNCKDRWCKCIRKKETYVVQVAHVSAARQGQSMENPAARLMAKWNSYL